LLEQALVDRAELFSAEVAVVDRAQHAFVAVLDEGEVPDCLQQGVVADLGGVEVGAGGWRPEEASQPWKTELRNAVWPSETGEHRGEAAPQVRVRTATPLGRQRPDPRQAVVAGVASPGRVSGVVGMEQF